MKADLSSKNVLVVDDEQAVLDGLRRVLRQERVQVHCAHGGHEALSLARTTSFDVIIVDQHMPGMCGTELLAAFRALHPQTMGILLTGHPSLEIALEAINSGEICRFFTKPCNDVELRHAVRDAVLRGALITESRRLVDIARAQWSYIEKLERENPGISDIERSECGAVMLPKSESDLEETLKQVLAEFDRAEASYRGRAKPE